jgi:rubrerythrin
LNQTIQNLTKAFIGESLARNRYTLYAKQAKKDGFEQVVEIFEKTAEQEREHASWLLKLIKQIKEKEGYDFKEIKVDSGSSIVLGTTVDNLKAAIEGENHEYSSMYPEYAEVAEKEGYPDIAKRLRAIAVSESHHEERFSKVLKEIENETLYKKQEKVTWTCRKCGYVHDGDSPPEECPSCSHAHNYFEKKCEDY